MRGLVTIDALFGKPEVNAVLKIHDGSLRGDTDRLALLFDIIKSR
jgi:hypothetical protein